MQRWILGLSTIALMVCAAPQQALAASAGWWLSAYAGYAKSTETNAPDGSFGTRLNATYFLSPNIGIGGEVGHHRFGKVDVDSVQIDPLITPMPGDVEFYSWQFTGQVVGRLSSEGFRPYATAGAGLYSLNYNLKAGLQGPFSEKRTKFGYNVGVGADFVITDTAWSVGGEFRYHGISGAAYTQEDVREISEGATIEGSEFNAITVYVGLGYNVLP